MQQLDYLSAFLTVSHDVRLIATSGTAQRIYVVLTAAAILAASIFVAYLNTRLTNGRTVIKPRGRPAIKRKTLQRQLRTAEKLRWRIPLNIVIGFAIVIIFGVAVPAGIYLLLAIYSDWLWPASQLFVAARTNAPAVTPSKFEIAELVGSQVFQSLTFAYSDLARLPPSTVIPNPGSLLAFGVTFALRAYMDLYALSWLQASMQGLWTSIRGSDELRAVIADLRQRLANAPD